MTLVHVVPGKNIKSVAEKTSIAKDYIAQRAINIATYIIENNATVRQAAKQFGVSKSTIHKDECAII